MGLHAEPRRFERPVMCAVDASDEAEAVARAGGRLAALTGAPLVLFHVARAPGHGHAVEQLLHRDRQARDPEEARTLLRRHATELPVDATIELAQGAPADEILVAAEELDVGLLVMGSRGAGVLDVLLGNVAHEVATHTTRATIIVPGPTDAAMYGGPVLCGVDAGDTGESARAASVAADVAAGLGAELVLLSVCDVTRIRPPVATAAMPAMPEPPQSSDELEHAARECVKGIAENLRDVAPVRVMVDTGDPTTRLVTAARELSACMIAIGNPRRSAISALLAGSVSSSLLHSASRPVLLVPDSGPGAFREAGGDTRRD